MKQILLLFTVLYVPPAGAPDKPQPPVKYISCTYNVFTYGNFIGTKTIVYANIEYCPSEPNLWHTGAGSCTMTTSICLLKTD